MGRSRPFIHHLSVGDGSATRVFYVHSNSSMRFPIKSVAQASPPLPVPHNAISPLCLLLVSGSLYRCQPHPIHRQLFVEIKSLHRPDALPNDLEYYLEQPCHNLLMHMGRRPSQHPAPKEERGEQLYSKMDMESTAVSCRESPSAVYLGVSGARVHFGLGDTAVLESS